MNGILPLWKPKGMTSHDCVMKIRRLFHIKKVGHTGTLDPDVEGVLVICIGEATKIVPFLTDIKKTYITKVKLGTATETEDSSGEIIETKPVEEFPSQQAIENVLQLFRGDIKQIPPMYSAVKVDGMKLYEYARANEPVERPERQAIIYQLDLLETDLRDNSFGLKIVCSQGTYIRTLCVDIGKRLGYPALMSELFRTGAGTINQENTVTFNAIEQAIEMREQEQLLLPLASGLTHMERIYVNENTKTKIRNGQKLPAPDNISESEPFLIMFKEQVLAVYQIHPENKNMIKPVRVFNE